MVEEPPSLETAVDLPASGSDDLTSLAVALAVGLILGFERGWYGQEEREKGAHAGTSDEESGRSVAGIRTFAIVALLGGVAKLVGDRAGAPFLPAVVLVLGTLLVAAYVVTSRLTEDHGTTTETALLLAFALGALAASGDHLEAVAAAVVASALLGFKAEIHSTLARLTRAEVHSSLQLLLIALVVLPLLPDRAMGPWNSLNPRMIGLLVMLIASIGFVGYFAIRILGERAGLLLTALFGGLTSSTAVTLAFSRMARGGRDRETLLAAGIAVACGTMAPRLLVEVGAVNPALLPGLLPGLLALAVVPLGAAAFASRRSRGRAQHEPVALGNPLELRQAIVLGGALAVVFMLTHAAEEWLGHQGVYGLALVSGLADVDAITLAVAGQARDGLASEVATRAILLAAISNTAFKAGLAAVVGGRALGRWVAGFLLPALGLAAAALVLT